MATADCCLHLAAGVWAVIQLGVFAFTWAMTGLLAEMDSALQSLLADLPTRHVLRPTRLVLEHLLAAHTFLLNEVWTLRAALLVPVAVMLCLWVAARLRPLTLMWTRRWFGAAGLWWIEHCTSAVTCDLLEDCLSAASTWSSVAEILADMLWVSALKLTATSACTDVLGFKFLGCSAGRGLHLPPCCKTC